MIIKNFSFKKKGAVELSLNLIIMLVIGLTVLGLIIAFVTQFLGDATEGVGQALPGDEEILRDLISRSGNFEFHRRDVTVRRGSEVRLYAKFENPLSEDVAVHSAAQIPMKKVDEHNSFVFEVSTTGQTISEDDDSLFRAFMAPLRLDASQSDALPIDLRVSSAVPTGNYFLTFTVTYKAGNDDENNGNEARTYSRVVTVTVE